MQVAEAEWVVTHADSRATLDQAHAEGLVSIPASRMIVAGGSAEPKGPRIQDPDEPPAA